METKMLKPLNFRYALVIEEMDSVRTSIVNVLKAQDWFVHGILRAEQALHILAYIPYRLIVLDSELPGICGIDFVRILRMASDSASRHHKLAERSFCNRSCGVRRNPGEKIKMEGRAESARSAPGPYH
jgi:PleD family two-component response regulator